MRIYFFEWNKTNPMHAHWILMRQMPEARRVECIGHASNSGTLDLSYFTSKSKCKFINLIHTRQKNKIICPRSWKIINKMVLKCHSTWRILTTLHSEKNGSVDVTFSRAITHQRHLPQSGREMRQMPEARRAECIGHASNSGKCIGFVLFHEQK